MLKEVNEAKAYFKKEFGEGVNPPVGTYAIPTKTIYGKAYMRVVVHENITMNAFDLFLNKSLTKCWYRANIIKRYYYGIITRFDK